MIIIEFNGVAGNPDRIRVLTVNLGVHSKCAIRLLERSKHGIRLLSGWKCVTSI